MYSFSDIRYGGAGLTYRLCIDIGDCLLDLAFFRHTEDAQFMLAYYKRFFPGETYRLFILSSESNNYVEI